MITLTAENIKNWAYAHAFSNGAALEIGLHDGPAFVYPKTEAIYLVNGADNAQTLMDLQQTKFVAWGDVEPPDYNYAIIRNGTGIGDVFFAITAGLEWALANQYPLSQLCIMLQPPMCKLFREFVFDVGGEQYLPNIVAIPVVENDLAIKFFDVWTKRFLDYVIFDCTVENAFTRTQKDIRFLGNPAQLRRLPNELTYYGENLRVAGLKHTISLTNRLVPSADAYDPYFTEHFRGKVVWHLRGSHVSKWYPYMRETALQLREQGIETVFVGAPDDVAFVDYTGIAKDFPVIANDIPARIISHIQHSDPLCVIGQETGFMAMCSLLPVKKILLLSHTPAERFADWKNTHCMTPANPPPCQPCYLSHSDFSRCQMHAETKAAECQARITPQQIIDAVKSSKQDVTDA